MSDLPNLPDLTNLPDLPNLHLLPDHLLNSFRNTPDGKNRLASLDNLSDWELDERMWQYEAEARALLEDVVKDFSCGYDLALIQAPYRIVYDNLIALFSSVRLMHAIRRRTRQQQSVEQEDVFDTAVEQAMEVLS